MRMHLRFISLVIVCMCAGIRGEDGAPPRPTPSFELPPITSVGTVEREAEKPAPPPVVSTPESVSTMDRATLENRVIDTTRDISTYIPNLAVRDNSERRAPTYSMRGLVNTTGLFGDPTVGVYVDGVPYADLALFDFSLCDVETLTVIRGTQGTAFGKNADAGMVVVETRQPDNTLRSESTVRYGNYNAQLYQTSLDGPLMKDKLWFSISASENKRNGYIENTYLHTRLDFRDAFSGRTELIYEPVRELRIALTFDGLIADDGSASLIHYADRNSLKLTSNPREFQKRRGYVGALQIAYTTNEFKITATTSRQSAVLDKPNQDPDVTSAKLFEFTDNEKLTLFTQEVRVESQCDSALHWFAGAYYQARRADLLTGIDFEDTSIIQAPAPGGLGLPFTAPVDDQFLGHVTSEEMALYGEARYEPIKTLGCTLGLRAETDPTDQLRHHRLLAVKTGQTIPVSAPERQSVRSGAVLPKIACDESPLENVSVYESFALGYRPNGLTYLTENPAQKKWKAERLKDSEAGVHTNLLGHRLSINASLFYLALNDFQDRRPVPGGIAVFNASRASSRGGELEITDHALKNLDLYAGFGYTDARFDKFFDPVKKEDLSGNRLQLSARYTLTCSADYHKNGFAAHIEDQVVGPYALNEDNTFTQGGFNLFNARLGYSRGHFEVFIYGKNLMDRRYSNLLLPDFTGKPTISAGDPRTFGIGTTLKF
jgi:iron complex outermembrane receptor protein